MCPALPCPKEDGVQPLSLPNAALWSPALETHFEITVRDGEHRDGEQCRLGHSRGGNSAWRREGHGLQKLRRARAASTRETLCSRRCHPDTLCVHACTCVATATSCQHDDKRDPAYRMPPPLQLRAPLPPGHHPIAGGRGTGKTTCAEPAPTTPPVSRRPVVPPLPSSPSLNHKQLDETMKRPHQRAGLVPLCLSLL